MYAWTAKKNCGLWRVHLTRIAEVWISVALPSGRRTQGKETDERNDRARIWNPSAKHFNQPVLTCLSHRACKASTSDDMSEEITSLSTFTIENAKYALVSSVL